MTWIDYFEAMLSNWSILQEKPTGNVLTLDSLDEEAKKEICNFLSEYKIEDNTYKYLGDYIRII